MKPIVPARMIVSMKIMISFIKMGKNIIKKIEAADKPMIILTPPDSA
ncbi:unnamed protein product, partial [marine sediment metagenome]